MSDANTSYDIGVDKPTNTYTKKVGCGSIYIQFLEHKNGSFDRILVRGSMAKTSDCGESWLWGIANLLTFSLRRAFKEDDSSREKGIVRQLIGHTCNVCSVATEVSCMSAIGFAVKAYIKRKEDEVKQEKAK